jgi:hypothetical protein
VGVSEAMEGDFPIRVSLGGQCMAKATLMPSRMTEAILMACIRHSSGFIIPAANDLSGKAGRGQGGGAAMHLIHLYAAACVSGPALPGAARQAAVRRLKRKTAPDELILGPRTANSGFYFAAEGGCLAGS